MDYVGYQLNSSEGEDWGLYIEDQAPVHGTKNLLVEAKRRLGIPLHDRPSCSPDLNPIENVWRIIKQRSKARPIFPSTLQKLKVAVQEEWDRLQPADWNKYIDSVPARILELKQRRGMQTRYSI